MDKKKLSKSAKGYNSLPDGEIVPPYMLVCGDPNRVPKIAELWDEGVVEKTYMRQHRGAYGTYKGCKIGAYNHGIGGASTEFILNSLMMHGAETFIRVGTTGAIQKGINLGDVIINDSSISLDGTSNLYAMQQYPSVASYEVTLALIEACETLGLKYHVGTGCTVASFFTGQCRPAFDGYKPSWLDSMYEDIKEYKVLNFEMEAATIMTLSRLLGKRAGICLAVTGNRETGEFEENPKYEEGACRAGSEAIRILTDWDKKKKAKKKKYFYVGLCD